MYASILFFSNKIKEINGSIILGTITFLTRFILNHINTNIKHYDDREVIFNKSMKFKKTCATSFVFYWKNFLTVF